MNREERNDKLIEYAEGGLNTIQRQELEELLRRSPDMQEDLRSIQLAFESLRPGTPPSVPTHYFNNFLPILRERIEEKRFRSFVWLPSWSNVIAAPLTALIIVVMVAGLYSLLKENNYESSLYTIIRQADQDELENVSSSGAVIFGWQKSENILAETPDVKEIHTSLIAGDILAANSLFENITIDSQILTQLSDQDIEMIVDKLNGRMIQ